MFQLVMVKVVWILTSTIFPLTKMIVALMVNKLCHIREGIIHPHIIQTNTGPILHHIGVGRTNLELLVMVEVVLVLGPPNSSPIKLI